MNGKVPEPFQCNCGAHTECYLYHVIDQASIFPAGGHPFPQGKGHRSACGGGGTKRGLEQPSCPVIVLCFGLLHFVMLCICMFFVLLLIGLMVRSENHHIIGFKVKNIFFLVCALHSNESFCI